MTTDGSTLGVALWRRVADGIERGIADGRLTVGTRLPSEAEIADTYRVNRHTVRRALAALAERGLVRAERGSGTYVRAPRLAYPLRPRTRFSEIVGEGGHEPGGQLIGSAIEPGERDICRRLKVSAGSSLLRLEMLRFADRIPISIATTWLPADRFEGAEKVYARVRSITRTLAHCRVRDYRRKSTRITAATVDAGDALRLVLALGAPVLIVDSTDVDGNDDPVLTTHARFSAERIEFVVENN
ncbi:putative HTH-type transcriptional regulator YurK [Afipia felis]|uniref:HTH-type transcriptional regulator YurK n=1 Tax=Afipia felis TaxID=1035 RepID=A0A090MWD6_AFIFE|nr:phosphonate metabolism transcriptional regulator PhnF [Afipia felis]CEG10559.1 putative HTH-type transcriptional regulator YurK [Afipia felis]